MRLLLFLVGCCALTVVPALGAEYVKSSDGKCRVRVLEPMNEDDTRGGDRGDAYLGKVQTPGRFQMLAVQAALDRMPPLLCHALEQLVFVNADIQGGDGPEEGILGIVYSDQPDAVYLSALNKPGKAAEARIDLDRSGEKTTFTRVVRRILHEAAHTAENLLESQTENGDIQPWDPAAKSYAAELIANMRLMKGFEDEWKRLHESFVDNSCRLEEGTHWKCQLGGSGVVFAKPYDPALAKETAKEADKRAHPLGVSSAYGAKSATEDLAEVVAAALGRDLSGPPSVSLEGYAVPVDERFDACWRLHQEDGPGVPSSVAALFTKLSFARDAGLITKSDFEACVGDIRHQHEGQGYFTYKANELSRAYASGVWAALGPSNEVAAPYTSFRFQAEGSTEMGSTPVTGRVRLKLDVARRISGIDAASWPRGLYLIDTSIGFGGGWAGNQFWFHVVDEGEQAGTFYATKALVLVTGSNHEIIEGSVFVVEGWRPWAPLPVPQGGLPQKATFRAVKPSVTEDGVPDDPQVVGSE